MHPLYVAALIEARHDDLARLARRHRPADAARLHGLRLRRNRRNGA